MRGRIRMESWARAVVAGVLRDLPDPLRAAAGRCKIVYEMGPPEPDDDGLLGLFTGCSLIDGLPEGPEDFPVITLFLREIWALAEEDERVFQDEVKVTFLHELGHFLGWGEEEIDARGLG